MDEEIRKPLEKKIIPLKSSYGEDGQIVNKGFDLIAFDLVDKFAFSEKEYGAGVIPLELAEVARDFFGAILPTYGSEGKHTFSFSINVDNTEYFVQSPADGSLNDNSSEDNERGIVPTLRIQNPERFLLKLAALKRVFEEKEGNLLWLKMNTHHGAGVKNKNFQDLLLTMWWNATLSDYEHPEEFIDHLMAAMKDNSFDDLSKPTSITTISSLSNVRNTLAIQKTEAIGNYETPFTIELALDNAGSTADFRGVGSLPTVRYIRTSSNEAEIFALQRPKLEFMSKEDIKEEEQVIYRVASNLMREAKLIMQQFPELWTDHIGNCSDLLKEEDPREFCKKLFVYVKQNTTYFAENQTDRQKFWTNLRTVPRDQTHMRFIEFVAYSLEHLQQQMKDESEIEKNKQNPKERAKLRDQIQRLVKDPTSESYDKEDYDENTKDEGISFTDVDPTSLVSGLTALALFKRDGVKDVIINLHLPIRWQEHIDSQKRTNIEPEKIEDTTTTRLAFTFVRLCNQVKGIEIVEYPDDGGKLKLRFTNEPLQSDTKIFQEIIDGVNLLSAL